MRGPTCQAFNFFWKKLKLGDVHELNLTRTTAAVPEAGRRRRRESPSYPAGPARDETASSSAFLFSTSPSSPSCPDARSRPNRARPRQLRPPPRRMFSSLSGLPRTRRPLHCAPGELEILSGPLSIFLSLEIAGSILLRLRPPLVPSCSTSSHLCPPPDESRCPEAPHRRLLPLPLLARAGTEQIEWIEPSSPTTAVAVPARVRRRTTSSSFPDPFILFVVSRRS